MYEDLENLTRVEEKTNSYKYLDSLSSVSVELDVPPP
uniref:Uncharacterized protein n=1 Tax=viral metagenome TaxID=1070528 RepID=A0A6C0CZL2_9ZZZZ